jgi:hypothetical protein
MTIASSHLRMSLDFLTFRKGYTLVFQYTFLCFAEVSLRISMDFQKVARCTYIPHWDLNGLANSLLGVQIGISNDVLTFCKGYVPLGVAVNFHYFARVPLRTSAASRTFCKGTLQDFMKLFHISQRVPLMKAEKLPTFARGTPYELIRCPFILQRAPLRLSLEFLTFARGAEC